MIGRDQFRAAIVEELSAVAGNSLIRVEQRLRRACAEAADDFGPDHVELAKEIRRAGGDFVFFGQAIFGRTAFHYVADIHVRAPKTHRFDHLREQLAGAADEGLALFVFVAAWAFTHEHKLRLWIADAEDDVRASFVEFAASAIGADIGADVIERIVFDAIGRFEKRW